MAVNHQHLRTFHAVATDGSVSRAARRLNTSQPTLSQKLFAPSDDIDDLLGDSADPTLLSVRLGSDCPIFGARLAASLRQKHPAMGIQVRIGNARETIRWLGDAQIDACVVSDPPGDNVFVYEPVYADRLIVALPAGHPRANDSTFPLAALCQERLLMREPTSRTRTAVEQLLATSGVM